jgi:hypothetical protein
MSKSYYFKSKATGKVFETSFPEYHKDCEQLSQAKGKEEYRQQMKAELLERFKKHGITKVYTNIQHVSSSGMQRGISCYIVQDGEIRCIDYPVQVILDRAEHKKGGTVCNGCGMDMAFDLVYNLSSALHGWQEKGGYQIKQERI